MVEALERSPVRRLYALIVVVAVAPVVALTYLTVQYTERAVTERVTAQAQADAAVAAEVVRLRTQGIAELVDSYARRPAVIAALAGEDVAVPLEGHLAQLRAAQVGISGAFITRPDGVLTHVDPPTPEIIGRDYSFRDWYSGALRSGGPYVSEAYRTDIRGNGLVVAVSTLVRDPGAGADDGVLGVIAAVYTLDAIQRFADDIGTAEDVRLLVTDQRGIEVARPGTEGGEPVSAATLPSVSAALAGRSGTMTLDRGGEPVLAGFAPVAEVGWAVVVEIPERIALAPVRRAGSAVIGAAGLTLLLVLVGLYVVARLVRRLNDAQRTLRDSEERTREIIESAGDAFISMDANGVVTWWNAEAERVLGWSRHEAVGRTVAELIVPEHLVEAHRSGLRRYLETGDARVLGERVEVTAVRRDGRELPVELGVFTTQVDDEPCFHAFLYDITERRRNAELLARARDDALAASRAKSQFLANTSHEIRTPLNAILGMTELLLDTSLDEEQREFAAVVHSSAEALRSVIDDILDFSKIEAGQLDVEVVDFDLWDVVKRTADALAPSAQSKGLEFVVDLELDVPRWVAGDPARVRQVLVNLLANAVKFTPAGEVVLRVTLDEEGEDHVVVRMTVADTGIGMAPGDRDRVFDAFTQADASTTRLYGGTGLGLAITRQLVELMGGRVGVDAASDQGSTFWLTLPLECRPEVRHRPPPPEGLRGVPVLVVDDNETNRTILERILDAWGAEVTSASSGDEALAALRVAAAAGRPVAVAILDLSMPAMDGIQLARAIRHDAAVPDPHLVLLTSSGQREENLAARAEGIATILTKPVHRQDLHDRLVAVMGTGQEMRSPGVEAEERRPRSVGQTRPRVLVVEDNPANRRLAQVALERLGCRVDTAEAGQDGVDAVATAGDDPYALILMDRQMPGMDGFEATARIRAFEGPDRRTPIVAMTAEAMEGDRERCLAAGMDDYLPKPAPIDRIREIVLRWTGAEDATSDAGNGGGGVDRARLDELRDLGGTEFLREMSDLFRQDARSCLSAMPDAVVAGDADQIRALAHRLKGLAGNLGASGLAEGCAHLEELAVSGDLARASELVDELEAEARAVEDTLDAVVST